MSRRVASPSPEARDTLRALRRAAKNALELGLRTGTPVYVMKNGKIVDLTKEQRAPRKTTARKTTASKSKAKRSSRKTNTTKT